MGILLEQVSSIWEKHVTVWMPKTMRRGGDRPGLAWTSVGGTTLQIEVNIMPGKGEFRLTGQLGDVMKESAQTGISYIRSISEQYGIDSSFFTKHDIHIHIPEGAVAEGRSVGGNYDGYGYAVRHYGTEGPGRCGDDRRDYAARRGYCPSAV